MDKHLELLLQGESGQYIDEIKIKAWLGPEYIDGPRTDGVIPVRVYSADGRLERELSVRFVNNQCFVNLAGLSHFGVFAVAAFTLGLGVFFHAPRRSFLPLAALALLSGGLVALFDASRAWRLLTVFAELFRGPALFGPLGPPELSGYLLSWLLLGLGGYVLYHHRAELTDFERVALLTLLTLLFLLSFPFLNGDYARRLALMLFVPQAVLCLLLFRRLPPRWSHALAAGLFIVCLAFSPGVLHFKQPVLTRDTYAIPHDDMGFPVSKYKPQEGNSAHSLQTTATDYAKFLLAMLQPKGLKASTVKMMLSPEITVEPDASGSAPKQYRIAWGLGWGLQQTPSGKAFWHWGDNNTFRCFVMAYPNEGEALVYFTNSSLGLRIIPPVIQRFLDEDCPAWEWLGYERKDKPGQKLLKAILEKGYAQAIPPFLNEKGLLDTTRITEWEANQAGYRLMALHRFEAAKKVFWANMQAFLHSANTYDSYAEAHLSTGDFETAREYYTKALEMKPENSTAESILRCLGPEGAKGNTTFRLNAYPHARLVTLAGDFNDWNPISLPFIRRNGEWICRIDLEPGRYEYKLIIDGVWTPDPRNPEVVVNNGNLNSVKVVEE